MINTSAEDLTAEGGEVTGLEQQPALTIKKLPLCLGVERRAF